VCAFARAADGQTLLVAAPIQVATLTRGALVPPIGPDIWRDDRLSVPAGRNRDLITGRRLASEEHDGRPSLRLADVFSDLPVAALLSD
jgi:maltooligosyltrehalose synthase